MSDMLERLSRLDTSVVSDVLDESGFPDHALSSAFFPLDPAVKLAGRALCASGRSHVRNAPKGGISPYELERKVTAGDVIVIDAGAQQVGATIGGFVAATLKAKGCTGVVVNGAIRDTSEIRAMGLPSFCCSTSPMNGARRWEIINTEAAVSLPGATGAVVTVHPGDLVLGDADGVLVIPIAYAEAVISASEQLMNIEERIRGEVSAGATREEAFARNPQFAHIKRLLD